MAITEVYVDPSIAGDSGTGTIGDPYGDLEYALATETLGTDGTRFNIKAGTAEVLVAALDVNTFVGGAGAATTPVVFQGYTSAQGDGGIGEIDNGGSNISVLNQAAQDHVHFIDMKMGNCGSSSVIVMDNWCSLTRCEIHTSSNAATLCTVDSTCQITDCHFHTYTGAGDCLSITKGRVSYCFIEAGNTTVRGIDAGTEVHLIGNIIKMNAVGATAIDFSGSGCSLIGNSLYNAAAGTSAGILASSGNGYNTVILHNIIEGWSGTGGYAIEFTSGSAPTLISNNLWYNCASYASFADAPFVDDAPAELSASAFNAPGSDDFRANTDAQAAAFVQAFRGAATSTNIEDAGACQRLESGGGGGGVKMAGRGGGMAG